MKSFAVACTTGCDDELKIRIARAWCWREALQETFPVEYEFLPLGHSLEEAKHEACNQDWMFDVVEIPAKILK